MKIANYFDLKIEDIFKLEPADYMPENANLEDKPKLKQEFYELVKNEAKLQKELLKYMKEQTTESLISMAHVKHYIFS